MLQKRVKQVLNLILAIAVVGFAIIGPPRTGVAWTLAVIVMICTALVNWSRLKKEKNFETEYWFLVLPVIFLLGMFGTLSAISAAWLKLLLGLLGGGIFYYYEAGFPHGNPVVDEEIFTLASAFLVLTSLYALYFYFTPSLWRLTLLALLLFFLIFRQAFYKMNVEELDLVSWIATLIILQTGIAVFYLPVHFLTATVTVFAVFYLIFVLSDLYFSGRLTKNKIYFQCSLMLILVLFSLLTSSWKP